MQFSEDYEKRIQDLERRVLALESIINGTNRNKPGRTPFYQQTQKLKLSVSMTAAVPIPVWLQNMGFPRPPYIIYAISIGKNPNFQYLYKRDKASLEFYREKQEEIPNRLALK